MNLIEFLKVALEQPGVQDYMKMKHQIVMQPKVDVATFIMIAKMVCDACKIACPFVDSLP